jgi:hypothetical protein
MGINDMTNNPVSSNEPSAVEETAPLHRTKSAPSRKCLSRDILISAAAKRIKCHSFQGALALIQAHAPNIPIYVVDEIKDREGRVRQGVYCPDTKVVKVSRSMRTYHGLCNVLHEISHAATVHEIEANPDSEHVKALHVLLNEARDLAAHYRGRDNILAHIDYFQNGAATPKIFSRDLYGLTNVYELVAETLTNRDFQYLLLHLDNNVRSDLDGAHPLRLLREETKPTALVAQALDAFSRCWRVKRLLQDVFSHAAAVMTAQALRTERDAFSRNPVGEAA